MRFIKNTPSPYYKTTIRLLILLCVAREREKKDKWGEEIYDDDERIIKPV